MQRRGVVNLKEKNDEMKEIKPKSDINWQNRGCEGNDRNMN